MRIKLIEPDLKKPSRAYMVLGERDKAHAAAAAAKARTRQ
jgi:hypothetical protein